MGYMLEEMDKVNVFNRGGVDGVHRHYNKVLKIINSKWTNLLKRPLYFTGYVLCLGLYFSSTMNEDKIARAWVSFYVCVDPMVPDLST